MFPLIIHSFPQEVLNELNDFAQIRMFRCFYKWHPLINVERKKKMSVAFAASCLQSMQQGNRY